MWVLANTLPGRRPRVRVLSLPASSLLSTRGGTNTGPHCLAIGYRENARPRVAQVCTGVVRKQAGCTERATEQRVMKTHLHTRTTAIKLFPALAIPPGLAAQVARNRVTTAQQHDYSPCGFLPAHGARHEIPNIHLVDCHRGTDSLSCSDQRLAGCDSTAKKAQPHGMSPPIRKRADMPSEDTSTQPPSCAATINALKESDADYLIADNRLDDPMFCGEQPPCYYARYWCSRHFTRCSQCPSHCGIFHNFMAACRDTQYHRYCWHRPSLDEQNGDNVQSYLSAFADQRAINDQRGT